MIDSGMANGTLVQLSEPTASPIFFAKQDGRPPRPCVDYRAINAASKRDSYPLPNLPAMIDRLAGNAGTQSWTSRQPITNFGSERVMNG